MRASDVAQLCDEDYWLGVTGTLFEPSAHGDLELYRGARIAPFIEKLVDLYLRHDQTVEVRRGILWLVGDFFVKDHPSLRSVAEHALDMPMPEDRATALVILASDFSVHDAMFDSTTSSVVPARVDAAVAAYRKAQGVRP